MPLRSFLALVFLSMLVVGCTRQAPPLRQVYFHNDAAKVFFGFTIDGKWLDGDGKEIMRSFEECFVEGIPAADVQDLLNAAWKTQQGDEIDYSWSCKAEYQGHVDGYVLHVVVHTSPSASKHRVIKKRYNNPLPS